MPSMIFPPTETADQDGLLAIGGSLSTEILVDAYSNGIFPWPLNRRVLAWFAPPHRCLLECSKLKIADSLRRTLRRCGWEIRFNTRFSDVIRLCASRGGKSKRQGTWITPGIIQAYTEMHSLGLSHSVECFADEELIGGLYGVSIGGMFAAESMFHIRSDASKVTLCGLVAALQVNQIEWFDAQVSNPFLESLGFREVGRTTFEDMLFRALSKPRFIAPSNSINASELFEMLSTKRES